MSPFYEVERKHWWGFGREKKLNSGEGVILKSIDGKPKVSVYVENDDNLRVEVIEPVDLIVGDPLDHVRGRLYRPIPYQYEIVHNKEELASLQKPGKGKDSSFTILEKKGISLADKPLTMIFWYKNKK